MTLVSQSSPSYSPSPVSAQHPWINHSLPRIWCKPSLSVTSGTCMTAMSYLFANTRRAASLRSSSCNIDCSSCFARSTPEIHLYTLFIGRVHHVDESVRVVVVVAPQLPDFVLSSHVPHSKLDVLVFHALNVET